MNRRQKIIVSVTGIFIVLLILIGLTYAYFLTRITGNSNPTSISVTTANLELVYGDGTTALLTSSTPIEPGKFTASKDFTVTNNGNALTDYAVTLEDFAVFYANDTVINGKQVKAGTVTKLEYPEDMKMTITCTIESDDEERDGQACGNVNGTLPTENSILVTNNIEVDDIHKYVLSLTYVDSGSDQSLDMNKTIRGKIDIIDPKSTIDLAGSVATYQAGDYVEINSTPIKSEILDGKYKIIGVEPGNHTLYIKYKDSEGNIQTRGSENLTINKGDTASVSGTTITFTDASRVATVDVNSDYTVTIDEEIKSTPITWDNAPQGTLLYALKNNQPSGTVETTPAETASDVNEARLLTTEDDYGTSYVYRGNVTNNYVNFAGMCWRVVRVEGDGSVKIILEDRYAECNDSETEITSAVYTGNWSDGNNYNFGVTEDYKPNFLNYSGGLADSFKNFQNEMTNYLTKLKVSEWCYDDKITATKSYGYNDFVYDETLNDYTNEYYGAYTRLFTNKKSSLHCTGTKLTKYKDGTDMYVGTLTADEMAFAGGSAFHSNLNFYLMNNYIKEQSKNYNDIFWWSLSPAYFDEMNPNSTTPAIYMYSDGRLSNGFNPAIKTSRPTISLKSGNIILSGEGTQDKPYVIG